MPVSGLKWGQLRTKLSASKHDHITSDTVLVQALEYVHLETAGIVLLSMSRLPLNLTTNGPQDLQEQIESHNYF